MTARPATFAVLLMLATAAMAGPAFQFPSIDGGTLNTADWRGGPVLVVNTASMCGYTPQYSALQALWDRYRDRGLVVLAVPSDDFAQEYNSTQKVKEFCEVNFNLTLPMTDITHVRGRAAHPFYGWVRAEKGFAPRWNFSKVLLDGEGEVVATWRAGTEPLSPEIVAQIERLLPR